MTINLHVWMKGKDDIAPYWRNARKRHTRSPTVCLSSADITTFNVPEVDVRNSKNALEAATLRYVYSLRSIQARERNGVIYRILFFDNHEKFKELKVRG